MAATYDFTGKRVLVTGASQGIGRDICIALAKAGAHVFAFARNVGLLEKLAEDSFGFANTITMIPGDVTLPAEQLSALLSPHFPFDGLVNNAGVALNGPVGEILEADIDRTFSINLKAPIVISQIVARDLIARQMPGSIVNVSSQASLRPIAGHTVYSSSKAGLDMATRSLASELGVHKIRVNSVNPTVVMTDMGRDNWSEEKKKNSMLDKMPIKRFAEIDEVVNGVLFLLSDASSMTTGMPLTIDGGFCFN